MAISVKSDFWGGNYAFINSNSTTRSRIAQFFGQRQMRRDRELTVTLLGAAAGSAAADNFKRVAANRLENGGKRTIETVNIVNRNTTAGDVTDLIENIFSFTTRPTSYPVDKATRP